MWLTNIIVSLGRPKQPCGKIRVRRQRAAIKKNNIDSLGQREQIVVVLTCFGCGDVVLAFGAV
jgi:hypothetical protein